MLNKLLYKCTTIIRKGWEMKWQDIVVPVTPCHVMIGLVTLILSADTKLLAKKWTRVGTVASGCLMAWNIAIKIKAYKIFWFFLCKPTNILLVQAHEDHSLFFYVSLWFVCRHSYMVCVLSFCTELILYYYEKKV